MATSYEVELSWTRIETYTVTADSEDEAIEHAIRDARRWDDAADEVTVEDIREQVAATETPAESDAA